MPRRRFTKEYKQEAVEYVLSSGKSINQCAAELGLPDSTLNMWVNNLERQGQVTSEKPSDRSELAAAKKRIKELEMENEFLKKAAIFFAKNQQ